MAKMRVVVAANFERNLEAIRQFLQQDEAPPSVYEDMVNTIVGRLFPLLEDHPRAGRDWLRQPPPTESGQLLQQRVLAALASRLELREFVLDQLLVLYAIDANVVTLLALRHHRQSGFDLA